MGAGSELGLGRAQEWGVGASGACLGWKSIMHYLGASPSLTLASILYVRECKDTIKIQVN